MRRHGISDFPDPKRAPAGGPSSVDSGYRITDCRGVLLEFPATINMQSPAYKEAAARAVPHSWFSRCVVPRKVVHANARLGPNGRATMVLRVLEQWCSRTKAAQTPE
jgi:hypothetical protein